MKTENTLQNKANFFAIYYGQYIGYTPLLGNNKKYVEGNFLITSGVGASSYIKLKPLESISDEDALIVAKIFNIGHLTGAIVSLVKSILSALDGRTPKSATTEFVVNWMNAQDFLRSKGYALPWMDLSVQDLIDYGWIKLTEQ